MKPASEVQDRAIRTYLDYIQDIRAVAMPRLNDEERKLCESVHLVYGAGQRGLRGQTIFQRWECHDGTCAAVATGKGEKVDLVEICALTQDSFWQIAGTTLHELGHVLAPKHGHDGEWKAACGRLGLRRIKAAGTQYTPAMFVADIRYAIAAIPLPTEGRPKTVGAGFHGGSCSHGRGSRGGQSFGKGSGRMRKFVCDCTPPVIVRAGRDELAAHCDLCGSAFRREDANAAGLALLQMLGGAQ